LADWEVDGGSALPDLRLTRNALAIGLPVALKAPFDEGAGCGVVSVVAASVVAVVVPLVAL
jgi:hypothetical protein